MAQPPDRTPRRNGPVALGDLLDKKLLDLVGVKGMRKPGPPDLPPVIPAPATTAQIAHALPPTQAVTYPSTPPKPETARIAGKIEPITQGKVPRILMSPRETKLLDFATTIANEPPNGEDMAFSHAILCQVGLPRAAITEREFMRRSGDAWLNVQAGWLDEGDGPVQQPVPYGVMPRLALSWVSTYAKRFNTREVPIGESAAQFLRLVGMESEGRRYSTLRTQMHALAACRLQLGFKGRTFNGQPVEQFDAWLSNRDTKQRTLWPGVMVLSEGYFKELIESGVPLDNRALMALSGSSLALDVYAWLAHRLYRIEGRPVVLYWKNLRDQFGQEYQGKDPDKDFKKKFLPALRKVLAVYPKARVKQVTGGLMLMSSPPPIPPKAQNDALWKTL